MYYCTTEISPFNFDLMLDPNEIKKGRLYEAHKRRDKEINDMLIDEHVRLYPIKSEQERHG